MLLESGIIDVDETKVRQVLIIQNMCKSDDEGKEFTAQRFLLLAWRRNRNLRADRRWRLGLWHEEMNLPGFPPARRCAF